MTHVEYTKQLDAAKRQVEGKKPKVKRLFIVRDGKMIETATLAPAVEWRGKK